MSVEGEPVVRRRLVEPLLVGQVAPEYQAQRGILEFSFAEHEDGMYMFHAHQSEFTELGWVGMFDVRGPGA